MMSQNVLPVQQEPWPGGVWRGYKFSFLLSTQRNTGKNFFTYFKNCGKIYATCGFPGVAVVKNLPANEGLRYGFDP